MQTVELADELHLAPAGDLRLSCEPPSLEVEDNLVLRAARALRNHSGVTAGASLSLCKRIPVAAGLGGGSSDAASALLGLARLWDVRYGCATLVELAAGLGSDVPYFLYGGICLVAGRGERVQPLAASSNCWYLLVNPLIPVSTADIFAELNSSEYSGGRSTLSLATELRAGGVLRFGRNDLQSVLFRRYPVARACFDQVQALAPHRTIVSGSGPTVVAHFDSEQQAQAARDRLGPTGYWLAVARGRVDRTEGSPCG